MASEAAVTVVINARGNAAEQMKATGTAAVGMGTAMRTALPSIATLGSSLTSLLIVTGALESKTGQYVTTTLAIASAVAASIPGIVAMVGVFRSLNLVMKATIVLQTVLLALSGFGLARIGAALAVGAVAVVGTTALVNASQRGGGGGGAQGQGNTTFINQGVMMGNEADARRLARQVQQLNREDTRQGR